MKLITKFILVFIIGLFVSNYSLAQNTKYPDQLILSNVKLKLNGKGERRKYFMTVYSLGLYLSEKSNNASGIYSSDDDMNMRLVVESNFLSKEKLEEAIVVQFKKHAKEKFNVLKNKLDMFKSVFKQGVEKNDVFDFSFQESKSVVYKNGRIMKEISGLEFKQILYKIWLDSNPVDDNLRDKLLGN